MLVPEVHASGTRTDLPGASSFEAYGLVGEERRWWYPRAFVDPYGDVFTVSHSTMFTLDASGDGGIAFHGDLPEGWRGGATSSAVMYAPGLILQVGGGGESNAIGGPALASAAIIDITSGTPVVTPVAPMRRLRSARRPEGAPSPAPGVRTARSRCCPGWQASARCAAGAARPVVGPSAHGRRPRLARTYGSGRVAA